MIVSLKSVTKMNWQSARCAVDFDRPAGSLGTDRILDLKAGGPDDLLALTYRKVRQLQMG
jgi:hypothetical protein